MTYRGGRAAGGDRVMRVLVVIAIALIAYWASTGGLDEIPVRDPGVVQGTTQSG